ISLTKQLIEEDKVVAIIGPTTSGESMKLKELCEQAQVTLISCAAAEGIVIPVAKYVFKTPQKDSFAVKWIYEDMKKKGIKKIGIAGSNTGFGNGGLKQLKDIAPEYGMDIIISETYDSKATDLTALLTKFQAKNVEAIVNWSIEPAQSIIAKNMKQLKMTAQLYQSHGFGNIKYVEAAGDAAEGIIFPCGRMFLAEKLPDSDPTKKLLVDYVTKYKAKFNEEPSTFGGHAYDALNIVVEAIKIAKSTDRAKVRDAIETINNFPGTAGVFNFTAEDHNGLDMDSFKMFIVKDGKFELYE
ncbi:MAG: ABC transporter substrate-binding protein, partial [Spirochaetes bacterium]|nr:ABC transporter substrate-binding protein [Spirochaetota bacterium]